MPRSRFLYSILPVTSFLAGALRSKLDTLYLDFTQTKSCVLPTPFVVSRYLKLTVINITFDLCPVNTNNPIFLNNLSYHFSFRWFSSEELKLSTTIQRVWTHYLNRQAKIREIHKSFLMGRDAASLGICLQTFRYHHFVS